jgi:membrane protease YdiL (CAAX protease family)
MTVLSRAWVFFVVTFAFSWACQLPAVLTLCAQLPVPALVMGAMALGSAGPSLVALWFSILERNSLQHSGPARSAWSAPTWLLWTCALLFNPVAHWLGNVALFLLGRYEARHLLYLPLSAQELAIAFIAPVGEELGFRGYALPRLQARVSPLAASLCIGVLWALWHIPTLLVPAARATSPLELGCYCASFVAGSVVYTWLYNAGRGSVVGPLLAHFGIHLDNVFRASTLGDGVAPLVATTLSMSSIALALVVTGRLRPETAVRCVAVQTRHNAQAVMPCNARATQSVELDGAPRVALHASAKHVGSGRND